MKHNNSAAALSSPQQLRFQQQQSSSSISKIDSCWMIENRVNEKADEHTGDRVRGGKSLSSIRSASAVDLSTKRSNNVVVLVNNAVAAGQLHEGRSTDDLHTGAAPG